MASRSRSRRPAATVAVATFAALVGLVFVAQLLPWLTRERIVVTSTPVPNTSDAPLAIVLPPGGEACLGDVAFDPRGEIARLELDRPRDGHPLRMTLRAPGYRAVSRVAAAPIDGRIVRVPIDPPPRSTIGSACVANEGHRPLRLHGTTNPRALTRTRATVGGEEVGGAFLLLFREAEPRSPLAQLPRMTERAAALSPLGPWAFWLLVPLALIAVPALVARALLVALRDDEASAREPS